MPGPLTGVGAPLPTAPAPPPGLVPAAPAPPAFALGVATPGLPAVEPPGLPAAEPPGFAPAAVVVPGRPPAVPAVPGFAPATPAPVVPGRVPAVGGLAPGAVGFVAVAGGFAACAGLAAGAGAAGLDFGGGEFWEFAVNANANSGTNKNHNRSELSRGWIELIASSNAEVGLTRSPSRQSFPSLVRVVPDLVQAQMPASANDHGRGQ